MKKLLPIILFIAGTITASAQSTKPFVLGIVDSLYSASLAQQRTINIYLPDGYHDDTAKNFPVIYQLDGSANEDFVHTVGNVQFLTMIGYMPPTIVVGIANINRKHDFTFPAINTNKKKQADTFLAYLEKQLAPVAGGSPQFISFIEKELQPYINSHYKTGGATTLIGQSLGGLLAAEILLKKPNLFDNYIIVSPSLWWDGESLLSAAPALLKTPYTNKKQVYITTGTEGPIMEGDAAKLAALLKQYKSKEAHIKLAKMPQETHLTILHRAVYNALLWMNGQ